MAFYNLEGDGHSAPARRTDSKVPGYLAVTLPQFFIALIAYGLRMYTRLWPKNRLNWSDWTMSLAIVFTIVQFSIVLYTLSLGAGQHIENVPPQNIIPMIRISIVNQILWVCAVSMVKISIACLMLWLKRQSRAWRWAMKLTIVILILSGLVLAILQLTDCTPIQANWDKTISNAKCVSPDMITRKVYAIYASFLVSDIYLALLPLSFIPQINRPLRERIVVGLMMCFGIFASLTNIPKIVFTARFLWSPDFTFDLMSLSVWTNTELFVGITAACVPMLKALAEKTLRKMGATFTTRFSSSREIHGSSMSHNQSKGKTKSWKSWKGEWVSTVGSTTLNDDEHEQSA